MIASLYVTSRNHAAPILLCAAAGISVSFYSLT